MSKSFNKLINYSFAVSQWLRVAFIQNCGFVELALEYRPLTITMWLWPCDCDHVTVTVWCNHAATGKDLMSYLVSSSDRYLSRLLPSRHVAPFLDLIKRRSSQQKLLWATRRFRQTKLVFLGLQNIHQSALSPLIQLRLPLCCSRINVRRRD